MRRSSLPARARAVAATALALLWPVVGHACAVCVAASDRNRRAFFDTTVLLSLLPLGMIGAGVWWLARRGRGFLAGEFEERDGLAAGETTPEAK